MGLLSTAPRGLCALAGVGTFWWGIALEALWAWNLHCGGCGVLFAFVVGSHNSGGWVMGRRGNQVTKRLHIGKIRYSLCFTLALCVCALTACDSPGSNSARGADPSQVVATPTVDIDHARQVFEAGGELTYEEVIALSYAIVGDPDDLEKLRGSDTYDAEAEAVRKRREDFDKQLEKCRLKESIGWFSWWEYDEKDINYAEIPSNVSLLLEAYDPYSPYTKSKDPFKGSWNLLEIRGVDEKDVAGIKYGQRIRVSGDLRKSGFDVSVKNAKYELLEDDFAISTPTEDELKDLRIVLERPGCAGACVGPDYTLTITGDGKVIFNGRGQTKIKGIVSSTLRREEIIELMREIRKADFFNLLDDYIVPDVDVPTYKLSIHLGGKNKTVVNRYAPARLWMLEWRIDQIVNSEQWVQWPK
jgi:hypothetical protein